VELLFIFLIGAAIGFLVRLVIRGRETHGGLLLGAVAAIASGIASQLCLWIFRMGYDGGWIWVISLVVGGLVSIIVAAALPQRRRVADRQLLTKLSGGRA
jgi:hypothetical protein